MFQKNLLKKRTGIVLSTILLLSVFLSTSIIVQAESIGIGKYLTVGLTGENFDIPTGENSDFKVIATKPKTEQEWTFYPVRGGPPEQHKVGAGDVMLLAVSADDYEFSHWQSNDYSLSEDEETSSVITIKATKYAEITAVFVKIVEQYIVTISSEGSGNYMVEDLLNPSEMTVDEGTLLVINFDPDPGYHVSAIVVNSVDYITLDLTNTESYSFTVNSNMDIHIIFEIDGIAFVAANSDDVNIFLSSQVGIEGINTRDNSFFAGSDLLVGMMILFDEYDLVVWEINTNVTVTDDGVVVVLRYNDDDVPDKNNDGIIDEDDELLLRLFKVPSLEGDVNNDGVVDGKDDSIVANAVNTNQQPGWYDPFLDVNNDGYVDKKDLNVINQNKGSIIDPDFIGEDVTASIDTENNLIYSKPLDSFSIFRCR